MLCCIYCEHCRSVQYNDEAEENGLGWHSVSILQFCNYKCTTPPHLTSPHPTP